MSWMLDQIATWLLTFMIDTFGAVYDVIATALLISPDVTALPQVQAMSGRAVWIVDTVFVLAFLAAGATTMMSGAAERARYEAKDVLPRLVVGFTAAHFSQLVLGRLVELANAFTTAITADRLDGAGALTAVAAQVTAMTSSGSPLFGAILVAVTTVLLASAAFGLLTRFAVLLVLAMIAPIALALHATQQTDALARLWWQTLGGALVTPCLQAVTLQAGAWMLLDPQHLLPTLGLPAEPGGLLNMFVVIVLLYSTVKIPSLVRQYLFRAGPRRNVIGAVVRVVLIRHGARALGIPRTLTRIP